MITTYITTADAKEEFAELVNRVSHHKEHIILTRRGNEIAAIVPLEDLHLLQHQQSKNELQQAVEALQEARSQGTLSLADFKHEIG